MDNIKIYIKTHPRRTIVAALLIAVILVLFYVIVMFALQKPNQVIVNPNVSIPVSVAVSSSPVVIPEASIIPPNVQPTDCLDTDIEFSNDYFSLCYPGDLQLYPGAEDPDNNPTEGRQELGLWRSGLNGGPVFTLDRTDTDNSLRYQTSVEKGTNYSETPKEFHMLNVVAEYMYELSKKNASEISDLAIKLTDQNIGTYAYTYKSNIISSFNFGGINPLPNEEVKVMILRHEDQDYFIQFSNDSLGVNQRIASTLIFK